MLKYFITGQFIQQAGSGVRQHEEVLIACRDWCFDIMP